MQKKKKWNRNSPINFATSHFIGCQAREFTFQLSRAIKWCVFYVNRLTTLFVSELTISGQSTKGEECTDKGCKSRRIRRIQASLAKRFIQNHIKELAKL